ncbi:MAG: hypothetical protein AAF741_13915 [Bacteroidota bacterium]
MPVIKYIAGETTIQRLHEWISQNCSNTNLIKDQFEHTKSYRLEIRLLDEILENLYKDENNGFALAHAEMQCTVEVEDEDGETKLELVRDSSVISLGNQPDDGSFYQTSNIDYFLLQCPAGDGEKSNPYESYCKYVEETKNLPVNISEQALIMAIESRLTQESTASIRLEKLPKNKLELYILLKQFDENISWKDTQLIISSND